jgi:hypothetical protein
LSGARDRADRGQIARLRVDDGRNRPMLGRQLRRPARRRHDHVPLRACRGRRADGSCSDLSRRPAYLRRPPRRDRLVLGRQRARPTRQRRQGWRLFRPTVRGAVESADPRDR